MSAPTEHPIETNTHHASAATKNMHTSSPTTGAARGGAWGQKTTDFIKGGVRKSENLREGINSFFDNAVQPSAARDADRGVTANHKSDGHNVPSEHGIEGHEIREGPARGTGTSGMTGSTATDGRTVGTGFSHDAKVLGGKIADRVHGHGTR